MTRRSIHGRLLVSPVFTSECADCGMPTIAPDEYHPYEACVEFKRTHSSRTVEPLLERLWVAAHEGEGER